MVKNRLFFKQQYSTSKIENKTRELSSSFFRIKKYSFLRKLWLFEVKQKNALKYKRNEEADFCEFLVPPFPTGPRDDSFSNRVLR